MSRNTWQETIEQTQLVLRQRPDHCFLCGQPIPGTAPEALLRAYLDAGHQLRLAVVCGRRACRLTLQDAANGRWQRLFDALTHWPDPAIYPHGPYWAIRRPHQLTFRTDPRRTTALDAQSVDDPDDAATLPVAEHRPARPRPPGVARRDPARGPWPHRNRR
jgi:hypothetical protein